MKTMIFALFSMVISTVYAMSAQADDVQFAKKKIKIGTVPMTIEIADNNEKLARGLMFRKKLADDEGMLFIFPDSDYRSFWMKNTFISLSVGFYDANKKLVDIKDMTPVKSELETNPPVYASSAPAKYALEVPQGWFAKHHVKMGSKFSGL